LIIRRLIESGEEKLFLIPQTIHAALSGDLASNWGGGGLPPLVLPEIVWPAIFHHDDGWILPDKSPEIDANTKRPTSFLDYPIDHSHEIWTNSIEGCGRIGSLAQYLVAKHFVILREHSDSAKSAEATRFIERFKPECSKWLDEWSSAYGEVPEQQLDLALEQLRFFDWFSLWLCLAQRTDEHIFEDTPGDIPLKITPSPNGKFVMDPWPWEVEMVHVAVRGYLVPDRDYLDTKDLQEEMDDLCRIDWYFLPQ